MKYIIMHITGVIYILTIQVIITAKYPETTLWNLLWSIPFLVAIGILFYNLRELNRSKAK